MVRVLVLEPSELDPVGPLGDWLRDAGAELEIVAPAEGPLPPLGDYDAVVCLGGEMSASDDAVHPWFADVRKLLAEAVSARKPVLGICLGAQLLALATGGQVRAGTRGPEVGPLLVAKRDVAAQDPLFADLPFTPDVMQFHSDEIHVLPPSAELLASSPRYPNQAFRVGACAYALQFHIETTPHVVARWCENSPESAAAARPGDVDDGRLRSVHEDIAETWKPFAERFVRLAARYAGSLPGDPPPPRSLPLV
ncbi:type 1 glutamine amidotransferase [Streptoalloteichus tenebrarius]|uniref:type 1 glutamine amidotransferase n=1 Tax=Streptoalloteichus tenebrarius (strain ATCC 17920 / DSM 40477 / JCM 4838 / CBS 697.72 / NBRC 16177 / NCIMB 11028 / NRRL B-12390 / A12253. 1 / ISP 5477) TaxID=1933 RepID=UPI0020A26E2D|nr:type 1 glutamine amidotransferase [Streptoalloteichus tenebrarius]